MSFLDSLKQIHATQPITVELKFVKSIACAGKTRREVAAEAEILIGDVASGIARYAEDKGMATLSWMGSRGMGAIGNLVMGSVATKVVHLTKLPVTLVK
ncbi:universal stress protein [bacterium]|nr:universal stress protein [bacterium]